MKRLWAFLKLFIGLVGFYFFTTVVLEAFNSSDFAEPVQVVVREKNLDPSAFFYSDDLFVDSTDMDVTIR